MSRNSPGPEDSRDKRERPIMANQPPSIGQSSSQSGEDIIEPSSQPQQIRQVISSIQPQIQPLQLQQNVIIQSNEGESSVIHGGSHSTDQSRLIGFISPTTAASWMGHPSLPQSYPGIGQPFIQPFIPSNSPPRRPIRVTTEFHAPAPFSSSLWSIPQSQVPPMPSLSRVSSQGSTQHIPRARGRRFSPPPIPGVKAALLRDTTTPQARGSLTSLPSITTLSMDTATPDSIDRFVGQPQQRSPMPSPESRSVQSHVSDKSQDDTKPLPQNLRGDPFRSAKVKTELCRFFKSPKGCVFGDKCNYAHGEHELKFNKLVDLEVAGLVDVEVFRCHACSTWVATGACPFDQRCTRLHDPRLKGTQMSWLPHAEVLINNAKHGREVDKLYHQRYSSIYSCSPLYGFAPKNRWKADETSTYSAWKEFYSFCCNMDANQPYSQGAQWRLSTRKSSAQDQEVEITEMHRLAMVLMMREKRKARHYIYLPSHVFCGELCLVLQTSYFRLEANEPSTTIAFAPKRYQVIELSKEEAAEDFEAGKGSSIIIAREIAFGPVADASVRPVSIWFNINPDDILPCTRQQARRHKRSRHRLRAKRKVENQPEEAKILASCSIPPFTCHQPMDNIAFNLITGIQTHRYRVLKYFSSSPDGSALRSLALEEEMLRKSFENQRRWWMTWTWPKKIGSSHVNEDTEVPNVDGTYNFVTYGDPGYGEDPIFFGSNEEEDRNDTDLQVVSKQAKLATGFIWKSYVMNLQLLSDQGAVLMPEEDIQMPTHDPLLPTVRRMPTLRSLSLGFSVLGGSRIIPRISMSSSPGTISLDNILHEWTLVERQYEENSSHPLKDAQQGQAGTATRRPLSYAFDMAAQKWSREMPTL